MRNYNDQIEAAYLSSRRQGNLMRNRAIELSAHEDRKNRYRDDRYESVYEQDHDAEDIQVPGNHRGKGPRGYRRSDERIKEDICDLFCNDSHLDATNIEVSVQHAEVNLSGYVDERYAKHLAEDIAEAVSGVVNVENHIRVDNDKKQGNQQERIRMNSGPYADRAARNVRYADDRPVPNEHYRGYNSEDYPQYMERYRRTEYPETYRSAMSGYMSEHVGTDLGRHYYEDDFISGNRYKLHRHARRR